MPKNYHAPPLFFEILDPLENTDLLLALKLLFLDLLELLLTLPSSSYSSTKLFCSPSESV